MTEQRRPYSPLAPIRAMIASDRRSEVVVKETANRHYYPTRQVLKSAFTWIERAIKLHPDLDDPLTEDIRWAIKTVLDGADNDLKELRKINFGMGKRNSQ